MHENSGSGIFTKWIALSDLKENAIMKKNFLFKFTSKLGIHVLDEKKNILKTFFGSEVFFVLIETAFMDDKGTDL